jgi:hypothetical protein
LAPADNLSISKTWTLISVSTVLQKPLAGTQRKEIVPNIPVFDGGRNGFEMEDG